MALQQYTCNTQQTLFIIWIAGIIHLESAKIVEGVGFFFNDLKNTAHN